MRQTELILLLFAAAASLPLAIGYAVLDMAGPAIAFAVTGIAWWAAGRRFGNFIISLGLFLFVLGAVVGVFTGMDFYLVLISLAASLGTWDLLRFRRRLKKLDANRETAALEGLHARRLLAVLVVGGALTFGAVWIEARFSFWIVVGIVAALLFSFERLLRILKKTHREA
jgi:hypothetical protein